MPSASEALLEFEFGQNPSNGVEELTNSGDNQTFFSGTAIGSLQWSNANGRSPAVTIDGVINGATITPSTTPDTVNVSAGLYNLSGTADQSIISAVDLLIDRPITDTHMISSVTITAGGAFSVVQGAESTAFSSDRGDPGGPPYVPVGELEVGQVRYTSKPSAIVGVAEIQQIEGLSRETPLFPFFPPQDIYANGGVVFSQPLNAIHTGDLPKGVYALYFTPIYSEVQLGKDFTPPNESATVNSDERYNATVASISRSLSAGSVNVLLADGHTDPIITADRDTRWGRFYSNRHRTPHIQGQSIIAMTLNYPADDNINADITMAAETVWVQKAS